MDCTLMHKILSVMDVVIAEDGGYIDKIKTIHNPEHFPIGTTNLSGPDKGKPNRAYLNDWWGGRSIPASRDGIEAALRSLKIRTPASLTVKCFGLSLSDQYWICPKYSELKWKAINFFDNDFSKDIGEILFGHEPDDAHRVDMLSPDNTSDGWLRKKWVIREGKRFLMKGGSGVFEQEPFNEVISSAVMRRLNIPHVPYTLVFDGAKPYSLCENFVTSETELIPAWRIIQTRKQDNSDSAFTHFLRCCDSAGIPGVHEAMGKMLTLDYIIANEDRHYNNFGFLRNAETLEWLGLAPVYDSGTSLWYNTQSVGSKVESIPFKKNHEEQIKLVHNLDWYNVNTLKDISEECGEILSQSVLISRERREAIAKAVAKRAECKYFR